MTNVTVPEALKAAIFAIESNSNGFGLSETQCKLTLDQCKAALAEIDKCEPVAWQFYQDGKWHNGMDTNNHKQNTIDAGFPVRDIFTSPQPREQYKNAVCRGSWALGSACGKCERCAETNPHKTNPHKTKHMSKQESFEKWYELHGDGSSYHLCKLAWNAAPAEANKRIAVLEGEVAELQERLETHIAINKSLLLQRDRLQADNKRLREALHLVNEHSKLWGFKIAGNVQTEIDEALNATPAESLQALENEVIERCAKVCDEDAQESRLFGESFQSNVATILAESIRALKEVK